MTCARCGAEIPGQKGPCPECLPSSHSTATLVAEGSTTDTGPLARAPAPAARFDPGQAFGDRYTIVEEVGAGGMGQVYKAIDRRLDKTVALKLIRPEIAAQSSTIKRFQRELALAQEVSHPNVCRVHDLGELEGIAYISMEYVEGQTLEDLIQSVGQLSPKQAVGLGRQICTALHAIHEKGIVHRDLKPRNVMVDRAGHAIVMDFGLAHHHGEDHITGAGAVLGTLAYLPPEQAQGGPTDARSDVYALGLILFEMLTGRRPPGDSGALPLAVRDPAERCPPPSHFAPEISPTLDHVVLRCLARDPGRRFASAAELAQALASAGTSFTSSISLRFLARRPVGSRGLLLLAGGASVVVLALVVWSWRTRVRHSPWAPGRGLAVAVLPLANVGSDPTDEYLGVGIADSLITKLASLSAVTVVSRAATLEYRGQAQDTRRIARDLGVTYVVTGGVQRAERQLRITLNIVRPDDSVAWGGEFEGGMDDLFALQRRVAEALSAALQLTLTPVDRDRMARPPSASVEAFADYSRARALLERPDIRGNLDKAIETFQAAIAADPKFALAHAGLGEAYWQQYRETKEARWVAKAQDSITEALRLDPEQPGIRFALAVTYRGTGRTDAAIEELHRVLALQPSNDDAHRELGDILADLGRREEAVAELKSAVEIRPNYWRNHSSLGYVYYLAGNYQEAIAAYTRVTELQPDNSRGFQMLGTAYQVAGDNGHALENYQRATLLGPDARAYSNLGTVFYSEGRFTEAARAFEQAANLEPNSPPRHRNLGDVYGRLGESAKAQAAYRKAIALGEEVLRINPKDARIVALVALCEAKLGRHAEAALRIAQADKLTPSDPEVLYKTAVIQTLAGRKDDSIDTLREALAHGYSAALARQDDDLASLRKLPTFEALFSRSKSKAGER